MAGWLPVLVESAGEESEEAFQLSDQLELDMKLLLASAKDAAADAAAVVGEWASVSAALYSSQVFESGAAFTPGVAHLLQTLSSSFSVLKEKARTSLEVVARSMSDPSVPMSARVAIVRLFAANDPTAAGTPLPANGSGKKQKRTSGTLYKTLLGYPSGNLAPLFQTFQNALSDAGIVLPDVPDLSALQLTAQMPGMEADLANMYGSTSPPRLCVHVFRGSPCLETLSPIQLYQLKIILGRRRRRRSGALALEVHLFSSLLAVLSG